MRAILKSKPRLSLAGIVQMNLGFLGLQFSFGLQQSNMGPIYRYLGANEATLPLLWLAGPMTGLLIQPIIGAMSDRTTSRWGRRTPYFLVGAVLCSLCLFAMPYSRSLWVAASLLWVLDAANNVTMEPYRAYVSDRLNPAQRSLGFLTQSAFTGLAQTLSYLAPSMLVWWGMDPDHLDANGIPTITRIAFVAGAVISLSTILWSIMRVPELPLTPQQTAEIEILPLSMRQTISDLRTAIVEMPAPMRQLAMAMLFQWYAMFAYWQYIAFAVGRSVFHTADPASPGFRSAVLVTGQIGGFYNFIAFVTAFAMVPLAQRFGAKTLHAICLLISGCAMLTIPGLTTERAMFIPMIGIGLGWASMMGNPYVMLANAIPPARTGLYMGIFNMFIVIPMLIESVTMPLIYRSQLNGDPRKVLMLAGSAMLAAAIATLFVRTSPEVAAHAKAEMSS